MGPNTPYITRVAGILGVLACVLLAACGVGPDRVRIESIRNDRGAAALSHRPTMVAYRSTGDTHAEILATDLVIEDLDPARGFEGVRGQITRVRMFAVPVAGKTPLSSSAGNTVIQHLVINDGTLAVYGGSGLLRPNARPGADVLAGVLSNGTMRLTRSTPGVVDPLGTARIDLGLTATLDAPLTAIIAARLDQAIEMTRPVRPDGDEPARGRSTP